MLWYLAGIKLKNPDLLDSGSLTTVDNEFPSTDSGLNLLLTCFGQAA